MRPTRTIAAAAAAAVLSLVIGAPVAADPVDLSGDVGLTAGEFEFHFGTADSDCNVYDRFAISDASSSTSSDAFDDAGVVIVGETIVADDDGIVEHTTAGGDEILAMDTQTIGDLEVELEFRTIGDDGIIRELLTLTNPTGASIDETVAIESNWGSDEDTTIVDTSSGDTAFTTADRWLVVFEDDSAPDTMVGQVFAGPEPPVGGLPVSAAETGLAAQNCAGAEGSTAAYDVTVPAGESRHLLWYFRLTDPEDHEGGAVEPTGASATSGAVTFASARAAAAPVGIAATPQDAVARMAIFDTAPAPGSALVAGISEDALGDVVNWSFPTQDPGPDPEPDPDPVEGGGATPAPGASPVTAAPAFTG